MEILKIEVRTDIVSKKQIFFLPDKVQLKFTLKYCDCLWNSGGAFFPLIEEAAMVVY